MDSPSVPTVREYRLNLDVDLPSGRFQGRVAMDLEGIVAPFAVHALDLVVSAGRFAGTPITLEPRPKDEEIRVHGASSAAGTLELEFSGAATTQGLIGLYRCRYDSSSILTTQFQPSGARRLFPCLDRPDRKAAVRLDLTTGRDVEAIFNMPVATEEFVDGHAHRTFLPTPPISTYLLYLGLGTFDWRRSAAGRRVAIGVATPPGRAASGTYALEQSERLLDEFERYYRIDYPLPKLDLVSVPEHAFGAMENWGAISFREMRLLIDGTTSDRQRRDTLSTIAHEIAHQWFGNLVTLGSWTDVWLNESFATLMEMVMIDRLEPTSGVLPDFLILWGTSSRIRDSLASTHPVIVPVTTEDDIGQAFDEISYGKGASVLRMFEGYLGEPTFRAGVTDYLNRFRYGNAQSADLWAALERASGQPMGAMLDAWLCRPGLPLVRARTGGATVTLTQERFDLTGAHSPMTWPIPLAFRENGQRHVRLFDTPTLEIPAVRGLHLNPNARGFYRVLYDDALYAALLADFPRLHETDRWAILEDLYAFALSGDVPLERYFAFVASQRGASDYLVVQELATELGHFASWVDPAGPYRAAIGDFLAAQWERLGPEPRSGEPESDAINRERIADVAVFHHEAIARSLAARYVEFDRLSANLHGPVAAAYARWGGAAAHAELRRRLASERREGDALRLEYALVSSHDPAIVTATLELTRTNELNRAHTAQIVRRAGLNPEGRGPAWAWMQKYLAPFADEYPGTDLAGYILQHTLPLAGVGRRTEVETYLDAHPIPAATRGAAKGRALLEVTDRFARAHGGVPRA